MKVAASWEAVSHVYRSGHAVGPVTLDVSLGEVVGLIGENGAGKTTLLKLLVGLLRPTKGAVSVWGEPVLPGALPADVSGVIEEPRFYPWATGRVNLQVACAGRPEREARIDAVCRAAGLQDRLDDRVRHYSQGMRQRLGIARALLGEPRLLILDEPTNGLDPSGVVWLRDLITDLRSQGKAVVLSSHSLGEVERLADRVAVVAQGLVLSAGPLSEICPPGATLETLYFSLTGEEG